MSATVVIDIFSGMPNPQWTITGDLLVHLKLMLVQLAHFHGGILPEAPGLGYRGIILQLSPDDGFAGPLRVYGEHVVGPSGTWVDTGRALEKWLVSTAPPSIDADILREIRTELE